MSQGAVVAFSLYLLSGGSHLSCEESERFRKSQEAAKYLYSKCERLCGKGNVQRVSLIGDSGYVECRCWDESVKEAAPKE